MKESSGSVVDEAPSKAGGLVVRRCRAKQPVCRSEDTACRGLFFQHIAISVCPIPCLVFGAWIHLLEVVDKSSCRPVFPILPNLQNMKKSNGDLVDNRHMDSN